MTYDISVTICTRNRAEFLAPLLRDLDRQIDRDRVQVLVVDNASTDSNSVAEAIRPFPYVLYVREPRLGLSHARNAGAAEASGEYVGYVDDDCRLLQGWIQAALDVLGAYEKPDIFGGGYKALHLSTPPRWYKEEYGSAFLERPAGLLGPTEYLSGGNFFIRKSLLLAVGGFQPHLGMRGRETRYGEETDLIIRARAANPGLRVYHEPRLLIYHSVKNENYSVRTIARKRFASGRASAQLHNRGPHNLYASLTKLLLRLLCTAGCLLAAPFRDRSRQRYIQNFLVEKVLGNFHALGWHYESIRGWKLTQRQTS